MFKIPLPPLVQWECSRDNVGMKQSDLGLDLTHRKTRKAVFWAAADFKDTLLRWSMKLEVVDGYEKKVQPRVQA